MAQRMGGLSIKVQVGCGTIACDNPHIHALPAHCHIGIAMTSLTMSSLSIIPS